MEETLIKIAEIVNRDLEIYREKLMRENFFPFHCINAISYMKNEPIHYNIYSSCWGRDKELILRGFCFGCDEGRKGNIINSTEKIQTIEYDQFICEGCKEILDKIQDTMIQIIQSDSHKGLIFWRISKSDFVENMEDLNRFLSNEQSDEHSIILTATDDGSMELLVAALVKAKFKNIETFVEYLNSNKQLYFKKYEKDLEKLKNFPFIKYSDFFSNYE